jgi:hypothetical protein
MIEDSTKIKIELNWIVMLLCVEIFLLLNIK